MATASTTSFAPQLRTYQQEMETELARILGFWAEKTPDHQHGGFVGQIDHSGQVNPQAPKGSILNARILWTFSAAFKQTGQKTYLEMATRAFEYMLSSFLDSAHGGVYWMVDAQGQPLNTRKQIYALAFTIYGMSEFYLATQNEKALQVSQELFRWIEKYSFDAEHGGYLEAFSQTGQLLEDLRLSEKDRNDPKTMNTHLHVLEAYANLYRAWPDQHLGTQLRGLIEVFLHRIIDPATGHLHLFFSRDWTSSGNLVSYGHDIEASWLLQEAAEVLGDQALLSRVKVVALTMANATAEAVLPDGSLYHELNLDQDHYDTHREWWVSAEAMVGFFNAYELTGSQDFLQRSLNSWKFAQTHLLDLAGGEWHWGVHDDYSLMAQEDKVGFWKCPYHNARACLEIMHRCQKELSQS
ncbi:AGE family epimerase/isomerase [Rufibacter glacialis]|uniref:Cellobiose 2-epimerase n=1 Tax=Rufibacter glacialis TaxID=1259555 RepID=A0A5M8Q5S8_9BACT|nr:AGE family epimerase/isomerase [Rufibacter glacialis]KAA6430266.1 N-acyl-D-glucosamine 2-epimerase [Rufibacter glacialis]GGK87843.1 cellobiose 2-epimerase [Rufibacter glacialis]